MSLPQEVSASYQALVESGNIRYVTEPDAAASIAAVSDGAAAAWAWSAYVEIVAAAVVTDPCWLAGVFLHLPVVEAFYGDFAIATGAAGSEVDIAEVPFDEELFAVVEGKAHMHAFPHPIKITGSPRLAVRLRKNTAASAAGCSLRLWLAEAIGT
ncbi:MAG: hypothetical protein GF350_05750 [Chitinivibrionales bacterium]|nr:hypothetical protein [Chitinivibrionales bacterium]